MNTLTIIDVATPRAYPQRVTAFTEPFWAALAAGRLTTSRCTRCHEAMFPPRPICPRCLSRQVDWAPVSPRGTLYSHTVVHIAPEIFAAEAPYALGIVDLAGGLRIAMRVLGPPAGLRVGQAGNVVCLRHPDGPYFAFLADEAVHPAGASPASISPAAIPSAGASPT